MPDREGEKRRSGWLLRVLVPILGSDLIEVLGILWRLGRQIISAKSHEGMYEVLENVSQLELKDTKGRKAVFSKQQRVRFLQNKIIAYHDKAWGDGEIFADYRCSPGEPVDRYQEGHRTHVLISLRETKNRGDVEEFNIVRTIKDGFTKPIEHFQIDIDHTTRRLSFSVVFPHKRPPKDVALIEQNAARTRPLGPEHRRTLPDGRVKVTWRTEKPRLFEGYILRWEW